MFGFGKTKKRLSPPIKSDTPELRDDLSRRETALRRPSPSEDDSSLSALSPFSPDPGKRLEMRDRDREPDSDRSRQAVTSQRLRRSDDNSSFGAELSFDSSRRGSPETQIRDDDQGSPEVQVRPEVTDLAFSRFQGVSRIFNWFYSSKEEELLSLQTRIRESLAETRNVFASGAYSGTDLLGKITQFETELQTLSKQPLKPENYAVVETKLRDLRRRFDALSTQQAILLGFDETFAIGAPKSLPPKQELIDEITKLATIPSLRDIGRLRYLVDALSQWTSDAVMRFPTPVDPNIKNTVAQAALLLNESFFYGVVKRDYKAAESSHLRAAVLLQDLSIDLDSLMKVDGAEPKAREDWNAPFDPGALMLAATLNDDNFIPDLVVGLPTGGAHAANKLAGALSVLKQKQPLLWYTRPQAVKEASKKIFQGVTEDNILRPEEVDFLAEALQAGSRTKPLRILVVDDGVVSGTTLELAKELYQKKFSGIFKDIQIRSATVKGGSLVEKELLPTDKPNLVDYVVNQTHDRAGNPAILRTREPLRSDAIIFGREVDLSAKISLATPVDIHSVSGFRTIKLGETLSEPR